MVRVKQKMILPWSLVIGAVAKVMNTLSISNLFVVAILGSIILLTEVSRGENCGQLAGVKGETVEILRVQRGRDVEKIRHGVRVEPNKVMPLDCDDIVITGRDSNAKIILANAKISLGPDSRIEIAQHAKVGQPAQVPTVSLINLTYGKMRALIQKSPANGKTLQPNTATPPNSGAKDAAKDATSGSAQINFRVRTFSAVAGVRGTDFFTSYEPHSGLTEQATIEGSVEVQQTGTLQKVVVAEGQQVAVETTPAAVKVYQEQLKSGRVDFEPPKNQGIENKDAASPKPIVVVPIRDSIRSEIRMASVVVKDDKEFTHVKAIETLGKPSTWTLEREPVPSKHDKLKNEF